MVLCSWDAEEYGLIGSTEWVEVGRGGWGCSNCMFMFPQDKGKLLGANTVAYLNVDAGVSGMRCITVATMYVQ